MIIIRKYFSSAEEDSTKKEEKKEKKKLSAKELEAMADRGIVAGTGTALIGGGTLALHKKLAKKHGEKFLKKAKNRNVKKIAIAASVLGSGLAAGSGVAKYKAKKKKSNENKA